MDAITQWMIQWIIQLLPVETLTAAGTIAGAIFGLFAWYDRYASPQRRELCRDLVIGFRRWDHGRATWPGFCAELVDTLFGERWWSMRCFLVSAATSAAFVVLFFIIWMWANPTDFKNEEIQRELIVIPFALLAFNVLPDYFSLLQSRYFLDRMSKERGFIRISLWLVGDALASALLFLTLGVFGAALTDALINLYFWWGYMDTSQFINRIEISYSQFLQDLIQYGMYFDARSGLPLSPYFYSTFYTTLFSWSFVNAILVARLLRMLGYVSTWFDVGNKPIQSLGALTAGVATTAFLLLVFILWIAGAEELIEAYPIQT